jgi:hypothetical protein
MSGTYANLEDALKRIAELEQRNKELQFILDSDAGDVPELKRRLEKAEERIEELEDELGELKKERKIDWDEVKCWWCNSRGCDTIQNGNPIHADCADGKEESICEACGVPESEECIVTCCDGSGCEVCSMNVEEIDEWVIERFGEGHTWTLLSGGLTPDEEDKVYYRMPGFRVLVDGRTSSKGIAILWEDDEDSLMNEEAESKD